MQIAEYFGQREAVMRAERNQNGILVRGRLQLKAESSAKPLAQCETPSPVDAVAERGVDDKLHSSALVEETFNNNSLARRHSPQRAPPLFEVFGNRPDDIGRNAQ